jgi:putative membrane protein
MIDWRHWHNEPYLIGGLILLGWLYAIFVGPLRGRLTGPETAYPKKAAAQFYGGLIVFYLAVGSPLDQIGERFLLSAHMVQHFLMIYVAAVMCLLGTPSWLIRPLTSPPQLRQLLQALTHPITCGLVYTLVISIWHIPGLYDWALQNKLVHVWEHLMFFAAALFFWWPIVSPSAELPPLRPASQLIYLVATSVGMIPLFAFIAFSDNVLYPTYEYAPRLISRLSPAEDQLLGAAIMKLGSIAVTIVAMTVAFYRWYNLTERNVGRTSLSENTGPLSARKS